LRVANWHNSDQARESVQAREIATTCHFSAHNPKATCERLAQHNAETVFTGRERKNVSHVIKVCQLPLRNVVMMNKLEVIRKWSVTDSSHVNESNVIHRFDRFHKHVHALPIRPISNKQYRRIRRQGAFPQWKLFQIYPIWTQK
jgi:hypothetical protein